MDDALIDRFVETWGTMGSFWGINSSVARVHALLIVTDRPWCLDDIAERLKISKSNASTCLKELRGWQVVRRVIQPGDRREFYTCEPDAWQMFFSIVRERKRREFDPLLASLRATVGEAERRPDGIALSRLRQMEEMLGSLERLGERMLSSGERARGLIAFLLGRE